MEGLNLCQSNKDFFGYTTFTFDFNGVKVRFVTEKDALMVLESRIKNMVEKINSQQQKLDKIASRLDDSWDEKLTEEITIKADIFFDIMKQLRKA